MPRPTPAQLALQDHEIGFLFHLDLTIFRPDKADHSAGGPPPDASGFNPPDIDPEQWVLTAKAAGARFALFTASHETGFMNWPSDLYPYGVKHTPWRAGRGDLVGEFISACRKHGLAPGLFIGLRNNCWWRVNQYRVTAASPGDQAAYNTICERQVEELCCRYGPLFEIWIEGGALAPADGGPNILPIVEKHQPGALYYHGPERSDHRWVGNERGEAGEPCWATMPGLGGRRAHDNQDHLQLLANGDPDGAHWCPAMCDAPLRNHRWFWHAEEDAKLRSLDELTAMHETSVGRNGFLVLGAVIDDRGLVPAADAARCAEFGQAIARRFAQPLAARTGEGDTLQLDLPGMHALSHVVLMEDITGGERIRRHRVRGRTSAGWIELCAGTSVGHKRIHRFQPVHVDALELHCDESTGRPLIRSFAAIAADHSAGNAARISPPSVPTASLKARTKAP